MKFPLLWSSEGASSKANLVWSRIVFSRLTVIYFLFSLVHFVIQIALQIRAFTINADAATFLGQLLEQGDAAIQQLPILRAGNISVCDFVDSTLDTDVETCQLIWSEQAAKERSQNAIGGFPLDAASPPALPQTTVSSTPVAARPTSTSVTVTTTTVQPSGTTTVFINAAPTARPQLGLQGGNSNDDDDDSKEEDDEDEDDVRRPRRRALESTRIERDGKTFVSLTGFAGQTEPVELEETCLKALNWPVSIIRNTKREDIVFIAFNFWVLGMSIVALLNESIPHIFASLLTHIMATAWAAFQITHTAAFRASFNRVITEGACSGAPAILPTFWKERAMAEIPTLAMHAVSLLVSCFLTWKLAKLYGWQTFKRVGASLKINRIYKIVLTLSITIQLSLFFMIVTVSLWIDQLINSAIGDVASFTVLYKVSSFITLAVLVPWLCLGWVSVRRELRLPMFGFLVISIIYLAGWGVMFFSTTFRWTFVTWRFFSIMASTSVFLTALSFILGVVCRFNFGKGLLKYLGNQGDVADDTSMYSEKKDIESFAFPSNTLVPTFASSYTPEELPYRYDQPNAALGPRFFNKDVEPFEQPYKFTLSPPPAALTRNLTDVSPIKRSDSNGSNSSSLRSDSSLSHKDHSREPSNSSQTRRWVIE